jgi:hypothetical protein
MQCIFRLDSQLSIATHPYWQLGRQAYSSVSCNRQLSSVRLSFLNKQMTWSSLCILQLYPFFIDSCFPSLCVPLLDKQLSIPTHPSCRTESCPAFLYAFIYRHLSIPIHVHPSFWTDSCLSIPLHPPLRQIAVHSYPSFPCKKTASPLSYAVSSCFYPVMNSMADRH